MKRSTLTTIKGTITIPKFIRDELGIKSGDSVHFEKNQSGRYELVKDLTLEEVREMNKKYTMNVPNYTDEELKKLTHEGMQQQAVDRYRRSLK